MKNIQESKLIHNLFNTAIYFVASYAVYRLIYDLTHSVAHWDRSFPIAANSRDPAKDVIFIIIIFIILSKFIIDSSRKNGKINQNLVWRRVKIAIIMVIVFLPVVALLTSLNNPW